MTRLSFLTWSSGCALAATILWMTFGPSEVRPVDAMPSEAAAPRPASFNPHPAAPRQAAVTAWQHATSVTASPPAASSAEPAPQIYGDDLRPGLVTPRAAEVLDGDVGASMEMLGLWQSCREANGQQPQCDDADKVRAMAVMVLRAQASTENTPAALALGRYLVYKFSTLSPENPNRNTVADEARHALELAATSRPGEVATLLAQLTTDPASGAN